MSAVDAAHAMVMLVAAQCERLLDQGRKVLAPALIGGDMPQAPHSLPRRWYTPGRLIAGPGRHQAVGGKQHRRGNIFKLRLLALPCRAEVACQMRIFFQIRIAVGGQHFTVGINVDAPVLPSVPAADAGLRRSCPDTTMNGPCFDIRVHSVWERGVPKVSVLARSSSSMHWRLTCPNSMMSASHSLNGAFLPSADTVPCRTIR